MALKQVSFSCCYPSILLLKKQYFKTERKCCAQVSQAFSNNEILFLVKQLEADHEAIKLKMLNDYDKMIEIEKRFDNANKLLVKRLKGE